jgi:Tfp pilus assembly protein PilZ
VPGDLDVGLGDEVDLELSFLEEQVRFHIRALVLWKRPQSGRRAVPPGLGLGFLPSEQGTKKQLLAFVNGEAVDHTERESRRFSVAVEVRFEAKERKGTRETLTDDLSAGGCFLRMDPPLPIGTMLTLKLKAPGALFGWVTVMAVVCWQRVEQGSPDRTGVGVEFLFSSQRVRDKVGKVVAVHKERLVQDLQIKAPRSNPPRAALGTDTPADAVSGPPASVPRHSSLLPRK